jgi:hypothetical protein
VTARAEAGPGSGTLVAVLEVMLTPSGNRRWLPNPHA